MNPNPLFFLIPSVFLGGLIVLFAFINVSSLTKVFKVRRKYYLTWIYVLVPVSIILWGVGIYSGVRVIQSLGVYTNVILFFYSLALLVFLPFSRLINRLQKKSSKKVDKKRRAIIKVATYVPPAIGLGIAFIGFKDAHKRIAIKKKLFYFKDLPPDLDGMRILQLSDLHLGLFSYFQELNSLINRVEGAQVDIVLITGDMCDHPPSFPKILETIQTLNPPLGFYASLGNHDYIRGVENTIKVFSDTKIKLLINQSVIIKRNEARMLLTGIDDPRYLKGDTVTPLRSYTKLALKNIPEADFKVMMSHRPNGIIPASENGFDLVLSGHTHGHQIGIGGRSIFEVLGLAHGYYYGLYNIGKTQLYVTGGMGHWIPYRLGVPAEAPIIVLNKA